MAKPEWGTKRTCQSCGQRFYDFGRSPAVCPACGATLDVETLSRARRARPSARAAVIDDEEEATPIRRDPSAEEEEGVDTPDLAEEEDGTEVEEETIETEEEVEDEEDEGLIEDASELGDDEDMSDVIEGEIDEEPR